MAKNSSPTGNAAPARRNPNAARTPVTYDDAERLAPTSDQLTKIIRTFGMDDIDLNDLRRTTEAHFNAVGAAMTPSQDPQGQTTAIKIHFQRIVGAFVGSAHGAAGYYDERRATARDLASKMANESRDEDRDGVAGFESALHRAQMNAARAAMVSAATLAQAGGALSAYENVIGEPWKPFNPDSGTNVTRQATAARASAFED